MGGHRSTTVSTLGRIAAASVAALLLSSCIGTISRNDFDEEIQARGGGFDQDSVLEVVEDLERRLGTADLRVRSFSISPASGFVVLEVRDPDAPRNLDRFVYENGDMQSTEPVQVSASEDLDALTFPLSVFALDRLEEMVDAALIAYDAEGGYVDGLRLDRRDRSDAEGGGVAYEILITLESPRSSAQASFTADGELIGVELR